MRSSPAANLRYEVARILDEAHGPCIDEGGCSFRAEHVRWITDRDYHKPNELDPVVDEIIAATVRGTVVIVSREKIAMTIFHALNGLPVELEQHPQSHGGLRAGVTSHIIAALEAADIVTVVD